MIAYIWVWAGFAMVVIAAGLAADPARRAGGGAHRRRQRVAGVPARDRPAAAPVLSVVFITMVINVLKVFDIVISVAPSSSQDDANVIALAMWRTSFGGQNDFGLGSAIAVFLFLLVLPVLALNMRRFRREADGRSPRPQVRVARRSSRRGVAREDRCGCSGEGAASTSSWSSSRVLWLVPTIGLFLTSLHVARGHHARRLVADLLQAEHRDARELPADLRNNESIARRW